MTGHGHGHGHGHDHAHHVPDSRGRLLAAVAISATILLVQVVGAVVTDSLALLVDTAHVLTDVAGLVLALVASHLARRPPSDRRTWGFRRAEVVAALLQSAALLVVGVYVLVEAVLRLWTPPEVPATELLVFGAVGLLGNLVALAVVAGGRHDSLNMRAAFLEVANDALGSVAVLVSAAVIALTGWQRADSLAALLIGALVLPRALAVLRQATSVLLETTPPGLDLEDVRRHLLELDHVQEVHDLHASLIATGLPVITAHVVVDDECFRTGHAARILDDLQACVAQHFPVSVEHSTFQVEPAAHRGHEHVHH